MSTFRILAIFLFVISATQPSFAQQLPDGMYHTIQHKGTGRYVDAYRAGQHSSAAVLRHPQFNDTQKWKFTPVPGAVNVYTIQQFSNSRFLDAFQDNTNGHNHGAVTRTAQNNDTQRWHVMPLGGDAYRLRQQSNGRFLEAHDEALDDFAIVTRPEQDNDTQVWIIKPVVLKGSYIVQHKGTRRLVDAYQDSDDDHAVVHRGNQKNLTQRWEFSPLGDNTYTIRQKSTGRYVDAYTDDANGHNFGLVTRTQQYNDTQRWIVEPFGNDTFAIRQKSTGRFIDAYTNASNDYALVTRPEQNDGSQEWKIIPELQGSYTIQQKSNSRHLDAHTDDDSGHDYRLVTNSKQGNDTQDWLFTPLRDDLYTIQQWHRARFMDAYPNGGDDHRLVTRPPQFDDSQIWKVTYLGGDDYTIQQKSTGRFVDAYQDGTHNVVTRNEQDNDTQKWEIKRASIPNLGVSYGSPDYVTGQGHPSVSDAIDEIVLNHLRFSKIPGATIAASKDGRLVFAKGYGHENVDTKKPMQPTSRSRIGSVSKIITALGFMRLSEQTPGLSPESNVYGQGAVLDHPSYMAAIEDHQTEHEDPAPLDWYTSMKVNHLMSHTSGNSKGSSSANVPGTGECEEVSCKYRKIIQHNLRNHRLITKPGTAGSYKNTNLGTVGHIIAEVSGQEYRDYIHSSILIPLGLSGIVHENGQTDPLDSEPHLLSHDGTSTSVYDAGPSTTGLAVGGWMASAQQMVLLMAATDKLPNQPDILSQASIDLMEQPPYPNASGPIRALGWWTSCQNSNASAPSCRMDHNGIVSGGFAYIAKYKGGFELSSVNVGGINVAVLFNVKKSAGHKSLTEEIAKLVGSANIPANYDLF